MKKNKNGLNTELLENGMTLQTNYDNGLKNGIEIYWYANGQRASEGSYLKNKLEGSLTYWYDNGTKASEGFYKNDKPEGIQTAWNENGQLESEQEYKNGVLNGASIFYENGVKTAEYVFKNGDVVYQVKLKNKLVWNSLNKKGFPNEKQAIELINRIKVLPIEDIYTYLLETIQKFMSTWYGKNIILNIFII